MRYSLHKYNIQYESMTANKPKEGKIQTPSRRASDCWNWPDFMNLGFSIVQFSLEADFIIEICASGGNTRRRTQKLRK